MKKFVTTIIAAALCCAMSVAALAAPSVETVVTVKGMTVYDANGKEIVINPDEGGLKMHGLDEVALAKPDTQHMEAVAGTNELLAKSFPSLAGKSIYAKQYLEKWGTFPDEFGYINFTFHLPGLENKTVYVLQYSNGAWQFGNSEVASIVKNVTRTVGAAKGVTNVSETAAVEVVDKYYTTKADADGNITMRLNHVGPIYFVYDENDNPSVAPTSETSENPTSGTSESTTAASESTTDKTTAATSESTTAKGTNATSESTTAKGTNTTSESTTAKGTTAAPTISGGQGGQTGDRNNVPLYAAIAVVAVGVAAVAFVGAKREKNKK